ncbi:MAG: DNA-binding response regulator [Nitrospirae bacterium]|nr:MAG: DNA-binding response regulator [Nitrospirota bacterium]
MKILVVEDDRKLAEFLKKGLQEEHYTVECAFTFEEALDRTHFSNYDLFIIDINLPDGDGFTLCRRLRDKGIQSPILILTGRNTVKDKVKGLDSGADDYLAKPFAFEELLARTRALLRRADKTVKALEYGPIRLEENKKRCYINGKEINLSPREYALLRYLLENQGMVLSRTQILNAVWGYEHDPGTNVVDVHVRNLRKKLKVHSAEDLIKTIRGFGYILE